MSTLDDPKPEQFGEEGYVVIQLTQKKKIGSKVSVVTMQAEGPCDQEMLKKCSGILNILEQYLTT